jgi:hypothetical protein
VSNQSRATQALQGSSIASTIQAIVRHRGVHYRQIQLNVPDSACCFDIIVCIINRLRRLIKVNIDERGCIGGPRGRVMPIRDVKAQSAAVAPRGWSYRAAPDHMSRRHSAATWRRHHHTGAGSAHRIFVDEAYRPVFGQIICNQNSPTPLQQSYAFAPRYETAPERRPCRLRPSPRHAAAVSYIVGGPHRICRALLARPHRAP